MAPDTAPLPDVYSANELARAAGVPASQVRALIRQATIPTIDGALVTLGDAVQASRALRHGRLTASPNAAGIGLLSPTRTGSARRGQTTGVSLLVSGSAHGAVLAVLLVMATASAPGTGLEPPPDPPSDSDLVQLVFVAAPGLGGGGGGGGRGDVAPPPPAERQGSRTTSSPLPRRTPAASTPPRAQPSRTQQPRPTPPPPLVREPLPELRGPMAAVGANPRDVSGLLGRVVAPPAPNDDSRGSGAGGGVGRGGGVGVGQGTGRGVGAGDGGGTGGGPYRPGSGIEPPGLLREVAPDYTDRARRAGLEGEVLLEMVVTAEGTVTDVRVLQRLGSGLDERAIAAVQQWQFSPARRHGVPVAVLVEVAVEFRLR
jgi:protein TonB